jgi:hypothetical protein
MSGQTDLSFEKYDILSWKEDYGIKMFASWTVLPRPLEWNSEFDKNYNIIRVWNPIQIEIWWGSINIDDFKLEFRVPNLKNDDEVLYLSWGTTWTWTWKIINWQLSSQNDILNASWSQIEVWKIHSWSILDDFWNWDWQVLENTWSTVKEFYSDWNDDWVTAQCWAWSGCILKMSVINKLELDDWTSVPYLEWRIITGKSIPLRYRIIKTTGTSYGFRKSLKIKIPQQTVNEAFDFTIFQ